MLCRTALLEAGFTPDDYFYDGMESPGLFGGKDRSHFEELKHYSLMHMCLRFMLKLFACIHFF